MEPSTPVHPSMSREKGHHIEEKTPLLKDGGICWRQCYVFACPRIYDLRSIFGTFKSLVCVRVPHTGGCVLFLGTS